MMKLYFIAAVSQDDITHNMDLFVWAKHPVQAVALWQDHYEIEDKQVQPDKVFIVPCDRPDGQQAGVLRWHVDVLEVGLTPVISE